MTKCALSLAARAVIIALLLVACGDGNADLSRAEVEEIVRSELADTAAPPGTGAETHCRRRGGGNPRGDGGDAPALRGAVQS